MKSPSHAFSALYEKAQRQGAAYTALDAMKFLAVVTMTIDHIGAYLFPDITWLRALGRIAPVIFFFFAGYSRTRAIAAQMWVYAAIFMVLHVLLGHPVFPANVLVSIIFVRLALNLLDDCRFIPGRLPEIIVACAMLSLVAPIFFEYGTMALLIAIFGRMVRDGKQDTRMFRFLAFSAYAVFLPWQLIGEAYSLPEMIYIAVSTAWVLQWLARGNNNVIWPNWRASRLKAAAALLSRNTIPYYFYHSLLLQLAGFLLLGPQHDGLTWVDLD